jgi:quercetin dioxygenase-like cupin family protein
MKRRELTRLFAALAAAHAARAANTDQLLPSGCFPFDTLPVKKSANGNETRQVLSGLTHEGYPIDLHITTLQPGNMPHPAHTHVHEEMIMLSSGQVEVTISGKATRLGPGGVAYVKSQELHGWKNVGGTPATYFVLAIGHRQSS